MEVAAGPKLPVEDNTGGVKEECSRSSLFIYIRRPTSRKLHGLLLIRLPI